MRKSGDAEQRKVNAQRWVTDAGSKGGGANAHGVMPPFEGAYRAVTLYDGGLNRSEKKRGCRTKESKRAKVGNRCRFQGRRC